MSLRTIGIVPLTSSFRIGETWARFEAKARITRNGRNKSAGDRRYQRRDRIDITGTAISSSIPAIGSGTARFTDPELPATFVGEFTPELIFGEPGGNPTAPASVSELIPFLGSEAPVNAKESPEPL